MGIAIGYSAMTEPKPQDNYETVVQPVTLTVDAEWADFLTRAQQARNEWKRYRVVDHIAVIDWRNLDLKVVKG